MRHSNKERDNVTESRPGSNTEVASVSVIGYRGIIPTTLLSWRELEINEQLSLRNSLNALCYQTNYANFVFPTMFMNEVLKLTSSCHERIR